MSDFFSWPQTWYGWFAVAAGAVGLSWGIKSLIQTEEQLWLWVPLTFVSVLALAAGLGALYARYVRTPRQERDQLAAENEALRCEVERLSEHEGLVERLYQGILDLATDPERAKKCSLVARLDTLDASFKVEWVHDDHRLLGLRPVNVEAEALDQPGYHGLRIRVHSRDHSQTTVG